MDKRPQGRQKLHRPGLETFLTDNYGKMPNAEIAERFKVTSEYLRNMALRMGLSKKRDQTTKAVNGIPAGYTKKDIVSVNALGMVLQKGAVRRHTMRG